MSGLFDDLTDALKRGGQQEEPKLLEALYSVILSEYERIDKIVNEVYLEFCQATGKLNSDELRKLKGLGYLIPRDAKNLIDSEVLRLATCKSECTIKTTQEFPENYASGNIVTGFPYWTHGVLDYISITPYHLSNGRICKLDVMLSEVRHSASSRRIAYVSESNEETKISLAYAMSECKKEIMFG